MAIYCVTVKVDQTWALFVKAESATDARAKVRRVEEFDGHFVDSGPRRIVRAEEEPNYTPSNDPAFAPPADPA